MMGSERTVWDARAVTVGGVVRRDLGCIAIASVRRQLEAAGGTWADHAENVRAAVGGFLEQTPNAHVILYAASAACHRGAYTGPGDVAMPRAVRNATRRIGKLLPALAAMTGLDALVATLGESSPVVQRLRENDRAA